MILVKAELTGVIRNVEATTLKVRDMNRCPGLDGGLNLSIDGFTRHVGKQGRRGNSAGVPRLFFLFH
jgi:hypothetical protein